MNMVALIDGQPKLLNLRQILDAFLRHRREVVTRRTVFELRKARERGHILEGLAVALSNVDEVIALIKAAPTPAIAKVELMSRFWQSTLVADLLTRARMDCRLNLVYIRRVISYRIFKRSVFWKCAFKILLRSRPIK